jgi:acetyl coenzyme A synthetase (ADP forming)-like protein
MMDAFFDPKSVAIIGASHKPGKIGYEILKNFVKGGYGGNIYPVNPDITPILDLKVYTSIGRIPHDIDLAVIATPAKTVPDILKDCVEKKVKGVIVVSGGFRESGKDGEELERKLTKIIKGSKTRMMGPNCLGVYDPYSQVDTLFNPRERMGRPTTGEVGFISQSGSVGITILDHMAEERMGISKFISYENATDIDETDSIEYLGDDKRTKTIVLFLEGVKDGRRFIDVAKNVSKKKPIIVMKGGKSKAGARAVASHTGSLAGSSKIYSGAFRQAGLLEADKWEELFDFTKAFFQPLPKGRRVAIITNGGGFGVLASDAAEEFGLELPKLPDNIKKKLRETLPPHVILSNPLDLTGSSTTEWYEEAMEDCIKSDKFDGLLLITILSTPQLTEDITETIIKMKKFGKPIISCTIGGVYTLNIIRILEAEGIPVYPTPERAAKAMAALVDYSERNGS